MSSFGSNGVGVPALPARPLPAGTTNPGVSVPYSAARSAPRAEDVQGFGDLSVAVGVYLLAAPAHRGLLGFAVVMGGGESLVVNLRIDPAENGTAQFVEIHGLIRIGVELQVMRGVAGFDQLELLGLRVVVGCLPAAALQRVPCGVLVARIAAPARLRVAANLRGQPYAALAVEHRIVRIRRIVGRIGPQMLVAPEKGRTVRRGEARRDFVLGLARGDVDGIRAVVGLIQNHQLAVARVHRIVRPAAIDLRMMLIGRDLIVHEGMIVADIPLGRHDVALDSRGARRHRRHGPVLDVVGPVRERLQVCVFAHLGHGGVHVGPANADAQPPLPGFRTGLELGLGRENVGQVARQRITKLMAEIATLLQLIDPVVLVRHAHPKAVAIRVVVGFFTRPGKEVLGRRSQQRQPVIARINLRGFLGSLRGLDFQRQGGGGGFRIDRSGIQDSIPSDENLVIDRRQIGQHVAALIVGHDGLDHLGLEIVGLRNHPHAGFGTFFTPDGATDVAGVTDPGIGRRFRVGFSFPFGLLGAGRVSRE